MIFIKLLKQRDGFIDPRGDKFLLVAEEYMDSDGSIPSYSQSFTTLDELKYGLQRIVTSGESIVVQASREFDQLIEELGLNHLASEWGTW